MAAGRVPTHRMKVKRRDKSGHYAEIGIGWKDVETGAIRLALYPGVTLSWRDSDDLFITLYPIDEVTDG